MTFVDIFQSFCTFCKEIFDKKERKGFFFYLENNFKNFPLNWLKTGLEFLKVKKNTHPFI